MEGAGEHTISLYSLFERRHGFPVWRMSAYMVVPNRT
jgi:hypothetical protein